jgi:hypothetical protein
MTYLFERGIIKFILININVIDHELIGINMKGVITLLKEG